MIKKGKNNNPCESITSKLQLNDFINIGLYNFEMNGEEQLFFVVECRRSMGFKFLRPVEQGKIECGKTYFKESAKETKNNVKLVV